MIGSALTGKGERTMPDREKVVTEFDACMQPGSWTHCKDCERKQGRALFTCRSLVEDALVLLKKQEVPQELKYKMWNALYAEEDKCENEFVGTDKHDAWFNTYRPWLQKGFEIAIKTIADWEGS